MSAMQAAMIAALSSGRAMTVPELRTHLSAAGFGVVPVEPVYQGLAALVRRGVITKVSVPGQSRAHWATAGSSAIRLGSREGSGGKGRMLCRDIA